MVAFWGGREEGVFFCNTVAWGYFFDILGAGRFPFFASMPPPAPQGLQISFDFPAGEFILCGVNALSKTFAAESNVFEKRQPIT